MLDDEMLDDKMLDLDDLYICFYVLYSTQLEAEANIPELKKKKPPHKHILGYVTRHHL